MSSIDAHKKAYKPRATVEEGRHKRQQENLAIRKQKREEHIAKRRQITVVEDDHKEEYNRIVAQFHMSLEAQCSALLSDDPKAQMESTVNLRKILAIDGAPPIPAPFARAIIPQLCYFLTRTDRPQLQFEAAWSLTNICAMNAQFTRDVVQSGAINSFMQILETSPHEDLRGQAVWALANIAGDTIEYRDLLLSMGTVPILLRHLERCTGALMLRNLTWAISNLCRGDPPPDFTLVKDAIPQLSTLLYSSDIEVVVDATWALSHLADGEDYQIQAVLDAGACKRLIDLTMNSQLVVQVPAVRAVGNIISGSDLQTQVCIANGVLPCLVSLFSSLKATVRKEACWIISNITAGNVGQKQAVIDANLVPLLIDSMLHAEFDIKKEALIAIFNICTEGLPQQIDYLVSKNLLEALSELLQLTDVSVLVCALSTLELVLRAGKQRAPGFNAYAHRFEDIGGTTPLNKLLDHPQARVYQTAMALMEHYFDHVDSVRESVSAADAMPMAFGTATPASPTSPFFGSGFTSLGSPSTPTSTAAPSATVSPFTASLLSPQAFSFDFNLPTGQQQPQSPFAMFSQGGGGNGGSGSS